MSKVIKPHDSKAFGSASKFHKEPFRLDLILPPKQTDTAAVPQSTEPTSPDASGAGQHDARETMFEADGKAWMTHDEASESALDIVQRAEIEAQKIVGDARSRAEDILRQARERGRADGMDEVKREVETQRQASAKMLSSFIEQMKKRESELMQLLTPRLADLATELAEKIIHREIRRDSTLVTRQAEQAITKILERDRLVIHVNPSDESLMKEHKQTLLRIFDGIDKIEIIADPEIERGGCVVETDLIKVDAQPRTQLKAARNTVLGENEQ